MRGSFIPDVKDEPYGPHVRNSFDLWLVASEEPAPLLLFIHGGGFTRGDKSGFSMALKDACLDAGIAFGAVNYRFATTAPYPAPMHDCARAVQTIRHHAAPWNLDPTRIACTGGSAGAGISLWLAFHADLADPDSSDPIARESTRISAAVVTAAQCSYDPRFVRELVPGRAYDNVHLKLLAGVPEDTDWDSFEVDERLDALLTDCAAITHLDADSAPVLAMYHAVNDVEGDIHHGNFGRHLKAEMDRVGVECIVRMDTDYPPAGSPSFVEESVAFLRRVFGME